MRGAVAVFGREVLERRLVAVMALGLGLVPLAAVWLPGLAKESPVEVRNGLALLFALVLSAVLAILLGGSVVSRDLGEGRLAFYFSRPLPGWAIWAGKLASVVALALGSALLAALPTALLHRRLPGLEGAFGALSPRDTWALLGLLTLALTLLSHALSVMLRARSLWLILDFVGAAVFALVGYDAIHRLGVAGAFAPQSWEGWMLVGITLAGLLAAGAAQVVAGRTDPARAHRALSLTLWAVLLAGALGAQGLAHWALAGTPGEARSGPAGRPLRGVLDRGPGGRPPPGVRRRLPDGREDRPLRAGSAAGAPGSCVDGRAIHPGRPLGGLGGARRRGGEGRASPVAPARSREAGRLPLPEQRHLFQPPLQLGSLTGRLPDRGGPGRPAGRRRDRLRQPARGGSAPRGRRSVAPPFREPRPGQAPGSRGPERSPAAVWSGRSGRSTSPGAVCGRPAASRAGPRRRAGAPTDHGSSSSIRRRRRSSCSTDGPAGRSPRSPGGMPLRARPASSRMGGSPWRRPGSEGAELRVFSPDLARELRRCRVSGSGPLWIVGQPAPDLLTVAVPSPDPAEGGRPSAAARSRDGLHTRAARGSGAGAVLGPGTVERRLAALRSRGGHLLELDPRTAELRPALRAEVAR